VQECNKVNSPSATKRVPWRRLEETEDEGDEEPLNCMERITCFFQAVSTGLEEKDSQPISSAAITNKIRANKLLLESSLSMLSSQEDYSHADF